ncbi:MAG: hypothetical protein HXY49_00905 [Ignavibacteriaceae bacterium]|nr:hypothetical protein [Ignavibacteriaceae bacterium]
MSSFKFEDLLSYDADWETIQYSFLKKVKEINSCFKKFKLYPALDEVILLVTKIENLLKKKIEQKFLLEKEVEGSLINDIIYVADSPKNISSEKDKIIELLRWSLSLLKDSLTEGMVIYEFVNSNLKIRQIGKSTNRTEGYFVIKDIKKSLLLINHYSSSTLNLSETGYETIDTKILRAIPFTLVDKSLEDILFDFKRHITGISNPALFVIDSEIDFPYFETILPVLKDKLQEEISLF